MHQERLSARPLTTPAALVRGVVSGVAGTVVMTAFQKLVEMPLTGREDSFAPARFAEKVFAVRVDSDEARQRLNLGTHLALGTMWGAAYGFATRHGLKGQRAVGVVFLAVYTGDVVLNTALGLYQPWRWSAQDWAVDIVDKLVQAEATGAIFDHVVGRSTSS